MKDADDTNQGSDEVDSILRRGLQTDPLSPAAMERIRAATETQWRAAVGVVELKPRWRIYTAAAAVFMLLLVSGLFVMVRSPGFLSETVLSRLERMEYPGVVELHTWSHDRSLASGETLRKGQRILARGGARIALPRAGSLRIAPGTTLKVKSDGRFILSDGDVYVDVPAAVSNQISLVLQTPAGDFTHVGTQFHLAVHAGQTEVRVREGKVRWSSPTGDVVAVAGTQIRIDERGKATTGSIDTTGADWMWAEMLADTFEIDNRSLAEFLRYFARETGRTLVFADAFAERRADAVKLHGSVQKLSQVEALSAVMSTQTSLRFVLGPGSVRIESAGDVEKKSR